MQIISNHTTVYDKARYTSSKFKGEIKKLSIIIPTYNEGETILLILERINDVQLIYGIEKEVIIINDASKDDSDEIIQSYIIENPTLDIKYFKKEINQGKGAAIQEALSKVTGDYIIIQDADLEYDPEEYNLLLRPILRGDADIVYGSRFMGSSAHRILFFWHTAGNKLLTLVSNVLTNLNLTDAHTCYKIIKTSTMRQIPLREKRFAFDAELNVKVSRIPKVRIYEVGISYYGRTKEEGKKIRFRDGVRSVFCLLKYSLIDRKLLVKLNPEPVSNHK